MKVNDVVLVESKAVRKNPAPRKGTAKPRRVSQATKRPPTKRLVARRQANVKLGYFPNPINEAISHVVVQRTTHDEHICYTTNQKTAEQICDLLHLHAPKRVLFFVTTV